MVNHGCDTFMYAIRDKGSSSRTNYISFGYYKLHQLQTNQLSIITLHQSNVKVVSTWILSSSGTPLYQLYPSALS